MSDVVAADPILDRLKKELMGLYGARLKMALLYGSRARGDFRPDSDYDVLVVLEPPVDWWEEAARLGRVSWNFASDTGAFLSLKAVTPEELQQRTGFMSEVRRESVPI